MWWRARAFSGLLTKAYLHTISDSLVKVSFPSSKTGQTCPDIAPGRVEPDMSSSRLRNHLHLFRQSEAMITAFRSKPHTHYYAFKIWCTNCLDIKFNIFPTQSSYVFHTILIITGHYFTSSINYSLLGPILDPWTGRLKNHGSIPSRGKRFFSSPTHSH